MIENINSSQKIFAPQLQCSLYGQLNCANAPYAEINYWLSFSEVRYCAVATLVSMDTPPDPIPHEELYHYSDTSAIKAERS